MLIRNMKTKLSLLAGAIATWHLDWCIGLPQDGVYTGNTVVTNAGTSPPQTEFILYHGATPPHPHPAGPVGGPPPSSYQHQQPSSYPVGGEYPYVAAQGGGHAVAVASGAFQGVPVAYTVNPVNKQTLDVKDVGKERHSFPSRERSARRALIRAFVFVLLMHVAIQVSQSLEGDNPDRTNILRMFLFTIPHFLFLGGTLTLLIRFGIWIRRLADRLISVAITENNTKTKAETESKEEDNGLGR